MPVVKNLRDLFSGGQDANPTLGDLANDHTIEREVIPPENPLMTARMPGDPDDHPLLESQKTTLSMVSTHLGFQDYSRLASLTLNKKDKLVPGSVNMNGYLERLSTMDATMTL
jgi:hypothetical protein